ncbi:MAG: DUF5666 domain-containing protein [Actinomycetota bacterium]|nr:DUF5666 domain-containing protein [Actinomycetota bacterium]
MLRRTLIGLSLVGASTLLAACGSAAASSTSATSKSTSSTKVHGTKRSRRNFRPPAATGTVAAVASSSMQVQGTATGETTVDWTSTTKFTKTTHVAATTLAAGTCVSVFEIPATQGSAATRTVISQISSGAPCSRPAFPTGGRRNRPNFKRYVGRVVSVSATSLTLNAITSTSSTATKSVTVPITSSTTVSGRAIAASSDLAVGSCVTVQGTTSSIGVVTATKVAISAPVNGTCSTFARGFGGGGFGGGGFGGQPASGSTSGSSTGSAA